MKKPLRFKVPATCAHLGPGFGVLGVAVETALSIEVEENKSGDFEVIRRGEMSHAPQDPRHDAILRALHAAQDTFKIKLPEGLRITAENSIPACSGLGTNSAAYAAGFGIATRYAKQAPAADELLDLLVDLGGTAAHGGAALYGGLVACCPVQTVQETVSHHVFRYALSPTWRFVIVTPEYHLGAADVIRVLPANLPHGVIKRTSGRLLGLLHALAVGDEKLLHDCLVDEVHVPFRRNIVPGMDQALRAVHESGCGAATISGAGPAIVMITTSAKAAEQGGQLMCQAFEAEGLKASVTTVGTCESGALPQEHGK